MLALMLMGCGDPPPPPPGRTVIVVVACTFRADRVSVFGGPTPMPHLEELAEQGLVVDRAMSAAPWTRPSVASIVTGRHPLVLGIDDPGPGGGGNRGIHPDFMTLAERFHDAGWSTVGITANPNANKVFGFDQGFDQYIEASGLWREGMVKVGGEEVVDRWAAEARTRSGDLYGQLLVIDTHKPRTKTLRERAGLDVDLVETYDHNLSILDDTLAHLDEVLAEMGRSDRIIVVVGDHGEGLNRPKWALHAHGRTLFDATVHVPLLFSGPGVPPGHHAGLASTLDLAPTLAALAGLPPHPSDGRDLLHDPEPAGVATETHFADVVLARWTTTKWTLIQDYVKGTARLYAADDPSQAHDLAAQQPAELLRLSAELQPVREALLAQQKEWFGQGTSDMEKAQLKALGYQDE